MKRTVIWDFEIKTDNLISAKWPDQVIVKKLRIWRTADFAVPADHRVKLRESEKNEYYPDLPMELKKKNKKWNMKVCLIPIVT